MANTNKKKLPGTKRRGPIILPANEQEVFLPGGPIILPLQQIHKMIMNGSITLEVSLQNKLAEEKLKGLTQELSKHGFNIDIKGDK
jgi:hypothetical protein